MTANLKMGFRLMRYAFGIKMNMVLVIVLAVCGLLFDFLTHGTVFIGMFLLSAFSMSPVQLLYSICISNAAGASPWRKRMQTAMPALLTFFINIIVFTVMIIIKMVEAWLFPEDFAAIWGCLVGVAMLQVLVGIYNGVGYKYFALSLVVMYVAVFVVNFGVSQIIREGWGMFASLSPAVSIVFIYGSLLVAAVLQYVVSLALYKRPLSKWAQGAAMRRYL